MRRGSIGSVVAVGLVAAWLVGAAVAPGVVFAAAGSEPAGIDPATGEPPGAPVGCCCIPKLHPTEKDKFDCKASVTEFDCKAECSLLKDGRLPSGCKWTKGECQP